MRARAAWRSMPGAGLRHRQAGRPRFARGMRADVEAVELDAAFVAQQALQRACERRELLRA